MVVAYSIVPSRNYRGGTAGRLHQDMRRQTISIRTVNLSNATFANLFCK